MQWTLVIPTTVLVVLASLWFKLFYSEIGKPLTLYRKTVGGKTLLFTGSLQNVLAGKFTELDRTRPIDVTQYIAGFEIGTPETDINSLGEFIQINGTGYTCNANKQSERFYQLIHGKHIYTSGGLFIPYLVEPSHTTSATFSQTKLNTLYSMLFNEIEKPFCFYGLVEFTKLSGIAVTKAPIHNESLLDNFNEYWSRPADHFDNTQGAVVGCVANLKTAVEPIKSKLPHLLYDNPLDTESKKTGLTSHTHVLKLRSHVNTYSEIQPDVADNVFHVLSSSLLDKVELYIFELEDLEEIKK